MQERGSFLGWKKKLEIDMEAMEHYCLELLNPKSKEL